MASFHWNPTRMCSKAQTSLNKILCTISSVKPRRSRRFDIDLNLSLVDACWELGGGGGEYENGNLDSCSFVGKQIESGSSGNYGEKSKEVSSSDITILHDVVEETKGDIETKPFEAQNDSHCFDLLIAAAELISSTEAEGVVTREKKGTGSLLSAGESTGGDVKFCTAADDLDDTSATMVRSKRGRSRVLPYRYRDSVLLVEPFKRRRAPKVK